MRSLVHVQSVYKEQIKKWAGVRNTFGDVPDRPLGRGEGSGGAGRVCVQG